MPLVPSAPVTSLPAVSRLKFLIAADEEALTTEPIWPLVCPRMSRIVLAASVTLAEG